LSYFSELNILCVMKSFIDINGGIPIVIHHVVE